MKAAVREHYGAPDVVHLADVERPEPGAGEVLVAVRAAGVDRGVWHLLTGLPLLVRVAGFGLLRPKNPVLGMEVAGVVEAVGPGVALLAPGDRVFGTCDGSFAEFVRTSADRLARTPARLTDEGAATLPVSGTTALQAVADVAAVRDGQRVLVIGASGGVGAVAVQIAKAAGAHVTGVCSDRTADLVRSLGADVVIDYTREPIAGRGERYDVVLDLAGNRRLSHLRRVLTPTGTLVIVGGESGGRVTGGTGRQLRAALLSLVVRQRLSAFLVRSNGDRLRRLADLVDNGQVRPVVDRSYPLEAAPDALRRMGTGRGKVVITV